MHFNSNYWHYLVAIIGFIVANLMCLLFSGQFEGDRADRSLFINLFGTQAHLHHWMHGLATLLILLVIEQRIGKSYWLDGLKGFSLGFIFHGITFYGDYFKILK